MFNNFDKVNNNQYLCVITQLRSVYYIVFDSLNLRRITKKYFNITKNVKRNIIILVFVIIFLFC